MDDRDELCVERWPECFVGGYDPRCCRFPKSCSCWKEDHVSKHAAPETEIKPTEEIDTTNDFLVASSGMKTCIIGGCQTTYTMDSAKAFRLAAWLVTVAEMNREFNSETGPTFDEVLEAIRST